VRRYKSIQWFFDHSRGWIASIEGNQPKPKIGDNVSIDGHTYIVEGVAYSNYISDEPFSISIEGDRYDTK